MGTEERGLSPLSEVIISKTSEIGRGKNGPADAHFCLPCTLSIIIIDKVERSRRDKFLMSLSALCTNWCLGLLADWQLKPGLISQAQPGLAGLDGRYRPELTC